MGEAPQGYGYIEGGARVYGVPRGDGVGLQGRQTGELMEGGMDGEEGEGEGVRGGGEGVGVEGDGRLEGGGVTVEIGSVGGEGS
jgi:hypothetical protein